MIFAVTLSLPYAIAILLSTAPVLAVVLVLATQRPARIAAMFPMGWALGIAIVVGGIVAVVDISVAPRQSPSMAAGLIRVILGMIIGLLAVRAWRGRADEPAWIARIARWSAARSFVTGLIAGSINPKNLALSAAGAAAILGAMAAPRDQFVAVAVFAAVASLGVAAPILLQTIGGPAVGRALDRAGEWMGAHGKALSAIVLAIIAVVLIGTGFSILTASQPGIEKGVRALFEPRLHESWRA